MATSPAAEPTVDPEPPMEPVADAERSAEAPEPGAPPEPTSCRPPPSDVSAEPPRPETACALVADTSGHGAELRIELRPACCVCEQHFAGQEALQEHMAVHQATHRFSCRKCVFLCRTKHQLAEHNRKQHVTLKRRQQTADGVSAAHGTGSRSTGSLLRLLSSVLKCVLSFVLRPFYKSLEPNLCRST